MADGNVALPYVLQTLHSQLWPVPLCLFPQTSYKNFLMQQILNTDGQTCEKAPNSTDPGPRKAGETRDSFSYHTTCSNLNKKQLQVHLSFVDCAITCTLLFYLEVLWSILNTIWNSKLLSAGMKNSGGIMLFIIYSVGVYQSAWFIVPMPLSLPSFAGLLNSQRRKKTNQVLTKTIQCMYMEKLN